MTDDSTFGGYLRMHARPPAFTGRDGAPYSAEALVDEDPDDDGRFGGRVLFVRWSPSGDQPVGHVETASVVYESTSTDARTAVLALSLYRLKALLDEAVAVDEERPNW